MNIYFFTPPKQSLLQADGFIGQWLIIFRKKLSNTIRFLCQELNNLATTMLL
jgi:hypothetical protein